MHAYIDRASVDIMKLYLSLCCLFVGANVANTKRFINPDSVYLYLYTPKHRTSPERISNNILIPCYYMLDKPTIFITHGTLGSYNSKYCTLLRNAFLNASHESNVIVLDWSNYANISYAAPENTIRELGDFLHNAIQVMMRMVNLDVKSVTLVGYNTGAQIMGNVGFRSNGEIGTIWGLNPRMIDGGGPRRYNLLNADCAKYVNVIHTSMIGYRLGIGTTDYYPNGGQYQPGCKPKNVQCNNVRALQLFAEWINTNVSFYGRACASADVAITGDCDGNHEFGGNTLNLVFRGYYFKTNRASPYLCGRDKCQNP